MAPTSAPLSKPSNEIQKNEIQKQPYILTPEDLSVLVKYYDKNSDGALDINEVQALIEHAMSERSKLPDSVAKVVKKFDQSGKGFIDEDDAKLLVHEIDLSQTNARYAAYSAAFARGFRYLAFTSDFGEALRPVVAQRVVTATYAISIGYCFADVAWEAHKLNKRGYVTEATEHHPMSHPMSMAQLVVERSAFQAVASVAAPFAIIHTTVDATKHALKHFKAKGALGRWGPSLAGLSIIPLLPLYLDEVVEGAVEWCFANYGPWASQQKKHGEEVRPKKE